MTRNQAIDQASAIENDEQRRWKYYEIHVAEFTLTEVNRKSAVVPERILKGDKHS